MKSDGQGLAPRLFESRRGHHFWWIRVPACVYTTLDPALIEVPVVRGLVPDEATQVRRHEATFPRERPAALSVRGYGERSRQATAQQLYVLRPLEARGSS